MLKKYSKSAKDSGYQSIRPLRGGHQVIRASGSFFLIPCSTDNLHPDLLFY